MNKQSTGDCSLKPMDLAYIPLVALLNLGVIYLCHVKLLKRPISGKQEWFMLYIASFLNTWGLDVLQHLVTTDNLFDVLKISLGAWLLFTAATSYKHYRFRSLTFRQFWLDFGGDLISYMIVGIGIYVCT
jgi:hypothetical protein